MRAGRKTKRARAEVSPQKAPQPAAPERVAFHMLRLGAPTQGGGRNVLNRVQVADSYRRSLERLGRKAEFDVTALVDEAGRMARGVSRVQLPAGTRDVRSAAARFDSDELPATLPPLQTQLSLAASP